MKASEVSPIAHGKNNDQTDGESSLDLDDENNPQRYSRGTTAWLTEDRKIEPFSTKNLKYDQILEDDESV